MNKEQLKKYLTENATITINATYDDLDIEQQFISGDPDYIDFENKHIANIYKRLNQGDVWAFALVNVKASFQSFEGDDYLGACSYNDEADFRQNSGYFSDMVNQAIDALADSIIFAEEKLVKDKEELTKIQNAIDDYEKSL